MAGATILATNLAGVTVARAISTTDGSYRLVLAAGEYELAPQVVAGQFMRAPAGRSITITPDTGTMIVDFSYDTGIR